MKVGIDILENDRMLDLSQNKIKLAKVFTSNEIDYFNKFSEQLTHITGNFCAKEAFVKALKLGFTNGITPLDVEILHTENGLPYVNTNTFKLKELIKECKVEINISHSKTASTAVCIIFD